MSHERSSIQPDALRALYEHSLDGLLLTAPTGAILAANPAACDLLGYTEEEIRGLGREGVVDTTDPRLASILEERRLTGRCRGELTLVHRSGRRIPVELSSVVFRDGDGVEHTSMIVRDLSERARERAGEHRARMLAEVTTLLTGTLDPETALTRLADVIAREMADTCITYLLAEDRSIQRVGIAHADPGRAAELRDLTARLPLSLDDETGVGAVIRLGEAQTYFEVAEERVQAHGRDELQARLLRALAPASVLILPLRARGKTIGAISLATTREGRPRYGPEDLILAQELADRAALAVDNARLYARATAELAERRRLDAALRDEEERFRATFEQAAVGVAHVAPDGRWLRVNQRLCEITGYTRDDLLALAFQDITHPDDLGTDLAQLGMLLEGRIDSYSMEKRYLRLDGTPVWVQLTVSLVRSAAGEPRYFISVVEDIDRRKRAERELRESEAFNRRLFESGGDCIKIVDPEGRLLAMNRAGQQMMQIRELDSVVGGSWLDFWTGEDRAAAAAAVEAAGRGVETRFQGYSATAAGAPRWWDVMVSPVPDGEGRIGRLLVVSRDVTGRMHWEQRLTHNQELLREAQSIAQLGSWEWNVSSGEITWSDELFRLYGVEPGSVPVDFESYLARLHPEDRERVAGAVEQALRSGEPFAFDHRILWPDGTVRFLHGRGRVVAGDDGAPAWMRGSAQDITERKQAEEEMRRALHAAEAANRAKGQFLAVMSHELRTPLTGIIGYADLLESGLWGEVSGPQRVQIARIKSGAWHLVSVIEEILTFSRLEAGKEEVRSEPMDLVYLASESADLVEPQALAKGLQLSRSLPGQALESLTDPGKLRQILLNLLGNAIKFTEAGSVDLTMERRGDQVLFHVRDSGPGIPVEERERIFEPFTQLDQSHTRTAEGTGLGLTVCRRLARLLGGEVAITDQGPGACLTLSLPLVPVGPPEGADPVADAPPA